ncbi:MAG: ArsI/CadI family heavy metal resistance metalloenzyme [Myxococcota bacterium]
MNSAIDFSGEARLHVGLTVSDLNAAVAFYEALFGVTPTKIRPGYAKFEVESPSVNLALNEDRAGVRPLPKHTHFGVQLKSTEAVLDSLRAFERRGLETLKEVQTECCHAVQDKVWVRDPDGHPWEVFVVTHADPSPEVHSVPEAEEEGACCAPTCCS